MESDVSFRVTCPHFKEPILRDETSIYSWPHTGATNPIARPTPYLYVINIIHGSFANWIVRLIQEFRIPIVKVTLK